MKTTTPRTHNRRYFNTKVLLAILIGVAIGMLVTSGRFVRPVVAAQGAGALEAPTGVSPTGDQLNNTHWKVLAGDTITDTITGATDAVTGTEGCASGEVAILIKSSIFGNTSRCGSLSGSTITFTWSVPATGGCETTIVAYATNDGGGFSNSNNSNIPGGNGNSPGGLAIVDSAGNVIGDSDNDPLNGCTSPPQPKGALDAVKYYDFNANGVNDAEPPLSGWPMTIDPLDPGAVPFLATQLTDGTGKASWGNLSPGPYTVTEGTPTQLNWFHSTAVSQGANVTENSLITVEFGNYCKVPSGGLTLGFWSNQNGQAILAAHDPAWRNLLNAACLRNADGSNFDVSTSASFANAYSAFRTWILGAKATNMAYMLSAQLAAMKLNIAYGNVDGNAFDLCSGMTINQLVSAADSASTGLCSAGLTLAGNPARAAQEARKNCLDKLNNGGSVVPVTPCAYTFPQ